MLDAKKTDRTHFHNLKKEKQGYKCDLSHLKLRDGTSNNKEISNIR